MPKKKWKCTQFILNRTSVLVLFSAFIVGTYFSFFFCIGFVINVWTSGSIGVMDFMFETNVSILYKSFIILFIFSDAIKLYWKIKYHRIEDLL
jgi:hypothetical protein